MNISILKEPGKICFADSGIIYKLRSSNQFSANGSKSLSKLIVTGTNNDGISFSLSWNNITETFIFKNNPDNNISNELPSDIKVNQLNGGIPDNRFKCLKILEKMAMNYNLICDFEISMNTSFQIELKSKLNGSIYNITYDQKISNVTFTSVNTGSDQELRTNYKLAMRHNLYDYFGNFVETLGEDRLPVDENGSAEFNISTLVKNKVETEVNFPPMNRISIINPLYIVNSQYGEYYNLNVNALFNNLSNIVIVPGGLSKDIFDEIENAGNIESYLIQRRDFLTNAPSRKIILHDQPEYLSYYVCDQYNSLNIVFKITTESGIINSVVTKQVNIYDKIELSIYGKQLKQEFGSEILSVSVRLEKLNGEMLTINRIFDFDSRVPRSKHYFLFKNSFGCIDTIRFSDHFSKDVAIERTDYVINSDNNGLQRIDQSINFNFPETYILKSAADHCYYPAHFMEFYQEFILSKLIYCIDGNEINRVVVDNSDGLIRDTLTGDYSAKAEIRRAVIDPHKKSDIKSTNKSTFSKSFSNYFKK